MLWINYGCMCLTREVNNVPPWPAVTTASIVKIRRVVEIIMWKVCNRLPELCDGSEERKGWINPNLAPHIDLVRLAVEADTFCQPPRKQWLAPSFPWCTLTGLIFGIPHVLELSIACQPFIVILAEAAFGSRKCVLHESSCDAFFSYLVNLDRCIPHRIMRLPR